MKTILQIVPRAPGSREGVGDYAAMLAEELERAHDCRSEFVTGEALRGQSSSATSAAAVVLHYVNYGYDARGIPRWLPGKLDAIDAVQRGRLVTIFHELYARGSWRSSAFWLQPLQKSLARAIAGRSAVCLVSSDLLAEQLRKLDAEARIVVRPVFSTFGEPALDAEQLATRDPQRWIICGGTELVRRSFRSFAGEGELFVVGGAEIAELRAHLDKEHYFPDVAASTASKILSQSAFGWTDYFDRADVPTAAVLKSTTFAAYCAHGVIPVFPHARSPIDRELPGPFTLATLPADRERPMIAEKFHRWYREHASLTRLAATVAEALAG